MSLFESQIIGRVLPSTIIFHLCRLKGIVAAKAFTVVTVKLEISLGKIFNHGIDNPSHETQPRDNPFRRLNFHHHFWNKISEAHGSQSDEPYIHTLPNAPAVSGL